MNMLAFAIWMVGWPIACTFAHWVDREALAADSRVKLATLLGETFVWFATAAFILWGSR